jgi:tetratricopeptide (TPR) repeat protein
MKKSLLLSAVLAALLAPLPVETVHAQAGGVDAPQANTRAARKAREEKKSGATNVAQTYPKATRVAPKQAGEPKLSKQLGALFELQTKNDSEDQMIAKAEEILADPRANAFDKSSAAYLAGGAWQSKETKDYSNTIKYYKQAVEFNGLHNNLHYQAMLQIAQMLDADKKSDEALTYVDRFLTETQSEDERAIAIKNQILIGSGKPEQAIAVMEKMAAAKPADKKLQMNLASLYQEAGQEAKALAILDRMRKDGLFTESNDYDIAWRLLANSNDRQKDAISVIEEGMQKGILTPGADVYAYLAQTYYAEGETDKAIAAWTKGAPLSKNGVSFLNLAKAQQDKERYADAKASAQQALAKGVTKPGEAWQVIGMSEAGLGNKAGAVAAYREAAKYPETRKWAESELRQASGK